MADTKKSETGRARQWVTLGFNWAEDTVYVGLGLLLAAVAITLLITEIIYFVQYLAAGALAENIVFLLDRILLIIIFVEVLYTVQVSFRQHVLQPEPFLVVGMIAVTRRILVLTAELSKLVKDNQTIFQNAMIELALLTVLTISLVFCLRMLWQRSRSHEA
jgi:uncharacterized membrane protein (DUF373 family)